MKMKFTLLYPRLLHNLPYQLMSWPVIMIYVLMRNSVCCLLEKLHIFSYLRVVIRHGQSVTFLLEVFISFDLMKNCSDIIADLVRFRWWLPFTCIGMWEKHFSYIPRNQWEPADSTLVENSFSKVKRIWTETTGM